MKYKVTLYRSALEDAEVKVDAASAYEACEKAHKSTDHNWLLVDWECDEALTTVEEIP